MRASVVLGLMRAAKAASSDGTVWAENGRLVAGDTRGDGRTRTERLTWRVPVSSGDSESYPMDAAGIIGALGAASKSRDEVTVKPPVFQVNGVSLAAPRGKEYGRDRVPEPLARGEVTGSMEWPTAPLVRAIKRAGAASLTDWSRPALQMVFHDGYGGLISCDGWRMHYLETGLRGPAFTFEPTEALWRMLQSGDQVRIEVEIENGGAIIQWTVGPVTLEQSHCETAYPDWWTIFRQGFERDGIEWATVDAKALDAALKVAGSLSETGGVYLLPEVAVQPGLDEASLPVAREGRWPVATMVNPRYLRGALASLKGQVRIGYVRSNEAIPEWARHCCTVDGPILVQQGPWSALVMPMFISKPTYERLMSATELVLAASPAA